MKYDGKDSVEISCDEFLEVPYSTGTNAADIASTIIVGGVGKALRINWLGKMNGSIFEIIVVGINIDC